MKIAVIAPSIYMSEKTYPHRVFAPRFIMLSLADGLVKKGHAVTLFSAPDIPTKASLVPGSQTLLKGDLLRDKYLSRELLPEYKLQSAIESQQLYSLDLISRAFQEVQKSEFDIIQTDDPLVHSFVDFAKTPTLFIFHDPLPRKNSLDYWFLNRYKHHNFISISNSQRRGCLDLNFVDTIYHGVSTDIVPRLEKGEYLAYMGRLLAQKGADVAIQVAKQTEQSLLIASDNIHLQTQFVKEKVLPFVDGKNIRFTGFMSSQKDREEFLGRAKALLFPISWEEPFGMVMIEAMACGTPVIAYNHGSVSEIVRDGVTGFIVDSDDEDQQVHSEGQGVIKKKGVEGLVEAVRRIGEIDRDKCRQHVEENFTVEKMVEGYENVYKKIINKT